MEIRLSVDATKGKAAKLSEADVKRLAEVLEKRLPIFATMGGRVEVRSPSDIRMRVPGHEVLPSQLQFLTRIGKLEVRHLDEVRTSVNPGGRYFLDVRTISDVNGGAPAIRFRDSRADRVIPGGEFLPRCPLVLSNEDLLPDSAQRVGNGALIGVRVQFNPKGSRRLERLMKKPGRLLAIALDGEIVSINAVTSRGTPRKKGEADEEEEEVQQIDILAGFNTPEEAVYLATVFNSGVLPAPIKVVSAKLAADEAPEPDK